MHHHCRFTYKITSHKSKIPSINWSICAATLTYGDLPSLECGEIMVPLDHNEPDGDEIKLVMTRLKATGKKPLGSLLMQSGGPGLATAKLVMMHASYEKSGKDFYKNFSPELREAYDVVGLDMRGEGYSETIYCDPKVFNKPAKMLPMDEEGFEQLRAKNKEFADSCANMTRPLFTKLGTDQVIQDLDLVRQALGDEKFNFFGYSYGTQVRK